MVKFADTKQALSDNSAFGGLLNSSLSCGFPCSSPQQNLRLRYYVSGGSARRSLMTERSERMSEEAQRL
ncbi:TPA: hypothetical protein ACGTJW_004479 [Salmonella enterica]